MFSGQNFVFMGEFKVAVDVKNRIMIPSKWRAEMGNNIVVSEGFEGAVEIRTKAVFQEYCYKLSSNDLYSKYVRVLKRKILGTAHDIVLDKWSRFVIPSSLNKGFKGSVIMRGNGDSIEIWNKKEYEEWSEKEENSLESAAEAIANN